ncbi:hypothetical protein [Kitasatospora sp. NPDC005856]|uniref:hypothetical protein n=1 Tax=Kitasatospora sp. NPDC005856 TaxID=3154566 RepID=UPI0033FF0DEC
MAMLYEVEEEIRDIIVEGRTDKRFFDWFTSEEKTDGLVRSYAVSDRVYITDAELMSKGLLTGERSRVLYLSEFLAAERVNSRSVNLVIDSDLHSIGLDACPNYDHLLRTDFSSIEVYALSEQTVNKLLRIGLGAPEEVTAAHLIESIQPPLVALFIVRACLRESKTGAPIPGKAAEKIYAGRGNIAAAVEEIFRLALDKVPKTQREAITKESLMREFRSLEQMTAGDARNFINGHDISELIVQYMKHRCKSVFNGESRRSFQAPPVMEVLMMGHVDRASLKDYPLFATLCRWLANEESPAED